MITYFDTSILMKLLIEDEAFRAESQRLWLDSDFALCAEIGYAEARGALAAVRRKERLTATASLTAKDQLELLWDHMSVIVVDSELVRAAGDLAERDGLRGYDAVHLAAAIAGQVTVVASADRQLVAVARRRGFSVAEPWPIAPITPFRPSATRAATPPGARPRLQSRRSCPTRLSPTTTTVATSGVSPRPCVCSHDVYGQPCR